MTVGLNRRIGWIAAVLLVTLASLAVVFGADAQAKAGELAPAAQGATQVFRDDVIVESGQTYPGDVAVYDGDVAVDDGGIIQGNLIVYSGDIEIAEGGLVEGDVTALSGDVVIDGRVGGNVASWSGDIELTQSAYVGGDVSVLNGEIQRDAGAHVGGSVVKGPSLSMPMPPVGGFSFDMPPIVGSTVGFAVRQPSLLERIGSLVLRLIVAGVFAVLIAAAAGILMSVRPQLVDTVLSTMTAQSALAFAIGLLVNLVLFFLAGILTVTICLAPVALVPMLVLLGINLVSWTAVSKVVGERLTGALKMSWQPAVTVAAGALLTVGAVAVLWAFGGCFRFLAFVTVLLVSSTGVGAIILPWLKLNQAGAAPEVIGTAPTAARETGQAEPTPVAPEPESEPASRIEPVAEPLIPAAVAAELDAPTAADDFTQLQGIGPVLDTRLKDAGIWTLAQLAALTAQELAAILGWTAARVERANLIGQAQARIGPV